MPIASLPFGGLRAIWAMSRHISSIFGLVLGCAALVFPADGICQSNPLSQPSGTWPTRLFNEDSIRMGKEKDPTIAYFKSDSKGWECISQSEVSLRERDFKMVLYHLMQAQNKFENDNDQTGLCMMHFKTGSLYQKWEVYERAMEQFAIALKYCVTLNISSSIQQTILLRMAACAQKVDDLDQAEEKYEALNKLYQDDNNYRGMKFSLSRLGDILTQKGDYRQALKYYYDLADVEERLDNKIDLAATLNNIGFLYKRLDNNIDAVRYFKMALQLNIKLGARSKQVISSLINIGSVCNQTGDYAAALAYLEQALEEDKKNPSQSEAADLKNFIAITLYNQGSCNRALRNINESIDLATTSGMKEVLVRGYRTKAQILDKLQDHQKATKFYMLYADLKDSISYEQKVKQQNSLLKNLSVEKVEKELRLLLTDAERNQLVMRQSALEAEREIRQKELLLLQREKEIQDYGLKNQALRLQQLDLSRQRLENENRLRALDLQRKDQQIKLNSFSKAVREKEHKVQVALLAKEKALLEAGQKGEQIKVKAQKEREVFMLGFMVLAIAGIGFIYSTLNKAKTANMQYRIKQDEIEQQNEVLATMNGLVEQKNRSITDSIKYARKIQASLFPGPEMLHQLLPFSTLFFRPRDVVSGDFYFLQKVDGMVFLATVDCTGHGVAGALLSMLGHQALNEIITAEKIKDPAKILHRLDEKLANIFRQDMMDLQQGMDIGICVIDPKAKKLKFAGAVQSLYCVQDSVIQVLEADRCSIGGLVPRVEKVYHQHEIDISRPVQCYLGSDGFVSQIGGPKNKRFTTKRLTGLFMEIEGQQSANKKLLIEKTFDSWTLNNKQTDDVLLIGFRPDMVVA